MGQARGSSSLLNVNSQVTRRISWTFSEFVSVKMWENEGIGFQSTFKSVSSLAASHLKPQEIGCFRIVWRS
ncbi:hypothetical protein PM082_022727 [Marasmius tenuissimus]|nr:hypothetical protein PM082_022727 [Marasmius tenuissimus]